MMAWDANQLDWHSCPLCGHECPPRPPMHGPTPQEIDKALTEVLSGSHDADCPMFGYPGGFIAFSGMNESRACTCSMRETYRLRHRLSNPEPED